MYEKKTSHMVIAVIAVILLVTLCWFYNSSRNDVSDIRNRADEVREQLESVRDSQQEERRTIESARTAVEYGRRAVEDSKRTASEIIDLERSDGEIIADCQSILKQVRERGKA